MERVGEAVVAGLLLIMAGTHPHAAAGAAFGCFFFLASPATSNRRQRVLLGVFSFGIGYAAGVFAYGGGPPYNEKAMFVAGSISALAAGIWTGLRRMTEADGPLPQWLKDTLGYIPFLRRKEPGDGP